MTALRDIGQALSDMQAAVILLDLDPYLTGFARSALASADHLIVPLKADSFSLHCLRHRYQQLREWAAASAQSPQAPRPGKSLPSSQLATVMGYVLLRHPLRLTQSPGVRERWLARVPGEYARAVVGKPDSDGDTVADDPHCLAVLKDYGALLAMAQEAGKPIFHLKPADGALGAHAQAVKAAEQDFRRLAIRIADRARVAGRPPSALHSQ